MLRKNIIEEILDRELHPSYLSVENESVNHHVPKGSETHFKLVVVSDKFISLSRIQRHQHIYKLLQEELNNGLHALSMHLFTPDEWERGQVPASPSCMDGFQHG